MQGADGTLVAEFRLAERLHSENIANDDYTSLSCAASLEKAFYQCADVASAGTVSGDLAELWTKSAEDLYFGVLSGYLNVGDTSPFGVECAGGQHFGDGVVNSFDIAVFVWAMFSKEPYNLPLDSRTVDIRPDLASECSSGAPRSEWQSKIGSNFCPDSRRRLSLPGLSLPGLSPPGLSLRESQPKGLGLRPSQSGFGGWAGRSPARSRHLAETYFGGANGLRVEKWAELAEGTWFLIAVEGIQQIVELHLGNLWVDEPVGLVNDVYPNSKRTLEQNEPQHSDLVEIRWARRFEYTDVVPPDCPSIVNGISGSVALLGDTLSIRQDTTSGELCAYDIYIYKPDNVTSRQASDSHTTRDLKVLAGSSWRNGEGAVVLNEVVTLEPIALPPPSSPPSSPLSPSPPSQASSANVQALVGAGVLLAFISSSTACFCCRRNFARRAPPPKPKLFWNFGYEAVAPPPRKISGFA